MGTDTDIILIFRSLVRGRKTTSYPDTQNIMKIQAVSRYKVFDIVDADSKGVVPADKTVLYLARAFENMAISGQRRA